jgi:hypothetical protein
MGVAGAVAILLLLFVRLIAAIYAALGRKLEITTPFSRTNSRDCELRGIRDSNARHNKHTKSVYTVRRRTLHSEPAKDLFRSDDKR